MPITPDRQTGPLIEDEEIRMGPGGTVPPSADGALVYRSDLGQFQFKESGVVQTLTGGGISQPQHVALDVLVHDIAENSFEEITRDGSDRIVSYVVWTSAAKTSKIRETLVARDGSNRVLTLTVKQYDSGGALLQTLTKTMARNGSGRFQSFTVTLT